MTELRHVLDETLCVGIGRMLQDLLDRSDNLYRRIARLDDVLFGAGAPSAGARGQLDALAQAFK